MGVSLAVVLKPTTAPSTELRFPNAAVATEEITCSEIGRDVRKPHARPLPWRVTDTAR